VGGEEERAGETLEAVGLGVVVAGGTGDDEAGVSGAHERGERLEEAARGGLPVGVGSGDGHRGIFDWRFSILDFGWGGAAVVRRCGAIENPKSRIENT
jgi:hypothetical protein